MTEAKTPLTIDSSHKETQRKIKHIYHSARVEEILSNTSPRTVLPYYHNGIYSSKEHSMPEFVYANLHTYTPLTRLRLASNYYERTRNPANPRLRVAPRYSKIGIRQETRPHSVVEAMGKRTRKSQARNDMACNSKEPPVISYSLTELRQRVAWVEKQGYKIQMRDVLLSEKKPSLSSHFSSKIPEMSAASLAQEKKKYEKEDSDNEGGDDSGSDSDNDNILPARAAHRKLSVGTGFWK